MTHTIGSPPDHSGPFGDVRDVLRQLPHPPDAGTSYALTDLFTVRHEIIKGLRPQPGSVFEFGALYGFFLVTALDADPSIEYVGWVDNEAHTPNSNIFCSLNVEAVTDGCVIEWWTDRDEVLPGLQYDLVQVDSDHTCEGCLADLRAAAQLDPNWIMVDDWDAQSHATDIRAAVHLFLEEQHELDLEWVVSEYVTVNGLAMLTRVR